MRKMIALLVSLLALVAVGAPARADTSTDVLLATIAGSRTLSVTTPTGTNLDGGALDLGTSHTGAFVVSVTDVTYDHVGYQVSSTLSNLYRFQGGFNCDRKVDSADLAVAFPVDPQLQDLEAIIQGLVDLEGTVSPALADLLDPLGVINTLLVGAGLDPLVGRPLSAGADEIAAQLQDALSGVLDGADSLLPVKVSNGSAGAFGSPAAHPDCGGGAPSPTSRLLMSGNAGSLGGFVQGLIDDLAALVDGITAADMVGDGTIDAAAAQAAAAAAVQGLADDLNAQLAGLGLGPVTLPQTGGVIDQVLQELEGVLGTVDLLGQSGIGVSVPNLDASPASAPQSGVYRGRMVVTIVDVP